MRFELHRSKEPVGDWSRCGSTRYAQPLSTSISPRRRVSSFRRFTALIEEVTGFRSHQLGLHQALRDFQVDPKQVSNLCFSPRHCLHEGVPQ